MSYRGKTISGHVFWLSQKYFHKADHSVHFWHEELRKKNRNKLIILTVSQDRGNR